MNKFVMTLMLSVICGAIVPGCGGSSANKDVTADADAAAKADYDAQMKASEEAMNSAPPQ